MSGELSKQGKANLLEVDRHISNQVYKNQEEIKLPKLLYDIYHIPSSIKREWERMHN